MDRVGLINLVIIILAYFTSYQIPGYESNPQKKHFLEDCLEEINSQIKNVKELSDFELGGLYQLVNIKIEELKSRTAACNYTWENKYQVERKLRLRFQALFNLTEQTEDYFIKDWPSWAELQTLNFHYHSQEDYAILFSNIQNDEILNIRKKVEQLGLTIETFLEITFNIGTKRKSHIHKTLDPQDLVEAYDLYMQEEDEEKRKVVCALLPASDLIPQCKRMLTGTSIDNAVIRQSVDKEMKNYRLLCFPKVVDEPINEESFTTRIRSLIEEHKLNEPLAYVLYRENMPKSNNEDFACILLNSFNDAVKVHEASQNDPPLIPSPIVDVVHSPPMETAVVHIQAVKDEVPVDTNGDRLKNDIIDIFNEEIYSELMPSSIFTTYKKDRVYWEYQDFCKALVVYQLLKTKLVYEERQRNVTITNADLHNLGLMKLDLLKNETKNKIS